MNAEEEIRHLSRRLNLDYERQDWGIINADPARVGEFIQLYEKEPQTEVTRYALEELIIASMNQAMVEGVADDCLCRLFNAFLRRNAERAGLHLGYWGGLQDSAEFPIAELLRRFARKHHVSLG